MNPRLLIVSFPLFLPALASAATVQLTNGDFSTVTGFDATGWTQVDGGGTNSTPSNYADFVPDSTWGRSMQLKSDGGNYVQQTLNLTDLGAMDATTFGSFTVGFDYGYRRDGVRDGDHTLRIALWNVTDNIEITGSDLVIADPLTTGTNSLAATSFVLNYDNTAGSLTGDSIAFRITSISGDLADIAWQRTAMIDNVAITAVPEPAAALLSALGVISLLRRRR